MKKRQCWFIAGAMILLLFSWWGYAQNLDWIHMHGLVSQGYIVSTDNNYHMNTEDASVEFNEAAINFTAQLTPKLRTGLQLFSRDFGPNGNNDLFLDWGYLDYQWKDYLGLRMGKIKRPAGFYNTMRDIDALRTFVLLPQGVYDESMREFTMSVQGASLYGNLSLSFAGDLEYETYYGISNINPDMTFTQELFSTIANNMGRGMEKRLKAQEKIPVEAVLDPRVRNANNKMRHSEGISLVWNTPLHGLRLGTSRMLGRTEQSATFDFHFLMEGETVKQITTPFESSLKFKALDIFSCEFEWNNLTLAGEYMIMDGEVTVDGEVMQLIKEEAYYAQTSYRLFDWLKAGAYYSVYYPDSDDKKGENLTAPGQKDFMAWQKDICATLRFDLNEFWLVKCEAHLMDGAGQLSTILNPAGVERKWQLYTVKTSIIF
ncbi:hypothetical protein JW835_15695 [bacterium]|nr:hypothetical protein [bacterium]